MNIAVVNDRINNISHPKWPKWFSIDKYECLQDLTVQDFLSELEVRLRLITMPTLEGRRLSDDWLWQFVEIGYVELRNYKPLQLQSNVVKSLNTQDIAYISKTMKSDYDITYCGIERQKLFRVSSSDNKHVLFSLDLSQLDNERLLGLLEYEINKLRKEYDIQEPRLSTKEKTNEKTFKKLFTYKVIPYLDLMLYCHNHCPWGDQNWSELTFTNSSLINLLFNSTLDEEAFKKTYQPFYQRIINNEHYLVRLLSNLGKNSWMLNSQMKNIY